MKVKKNNYYILTVLTFILVSLIYLYSSNFFSKLKNVINYFNTRTSSLNIVIDSDFLNYIKNEQNQINVSKYLLKIILFYEKKEIDSYISIYGSINRTVTPHLVLNFNDGFNINFIRLNNHLVNYEYENDKLIINTENIGVDTFKIEIKYTGKPEAKGFGSFIFGKIDNKQIIYTLNEPIFASTWIPCNDKPDDKALFEVEITNKNNFISVSNGILVDTNAVGNLKTYHYTTLYPISTYLMAIYSAEYNCFEDKVIVTNNDTIPIFYYLINNKKLHEYKNYQPHKEAIKIFSKLFGEYPFKKEKYGIAEISWPYGAIEHQTITGVSSNIINSPNFYESVFIHELAHQWWGNAVGLKTWKDIWLNEGFATYSEALYNEQKFGIKSLQSTMRKFISNFDESALYNPTSSLFSRLQYNKGAWVLHMLRGEIGDKLFFESLRNYYAAFLYKNASTEDFKYICEKTSNKNLNYFFYQWVYKGKGEIKLKYTWKNENSNVLISINQHKNDVVYHFPMKVKLLKYNKTSEIRDFYISSKDTILTIKGIDKIKDVILDPEKNLLLKIIN